MATKKRQPVRKPKRRLSRKPAKAIRRDRPAITGSMAAEAVPAEGNGLPELASPPVAELGSQPVEAEAADTEPSRPVRARFLVVGIGASAGGLEALQEFFGHLPPDSGAAFVVVTHQHPGHVTLLPTILAKATPMPVLEARDGLFVEPNHVYVGVPGGFLAITGGMLRRVDVDSTRAPHLPIDYFFRSLAADQHEHAVCVVLSGTGTDGTLGMKAIKAEFGMAMVQEPPSAKYAGMPASAAGTGLADYVLPAAVLPEQLVAYARGPHLRGRPSAVESPPFPTEPLQRIMMLLRARTGHDFACYKKTTICRRIERRMSVHLIKEPQEYVRYLQENPREIDLLFSELLISVTSFFRDPPAYDFLVEKALPELIGSRPEDHVFRAWVPGCASGEEAYSLAILLHERMAQLKRRLNVQIFATDLDGRAIEAARAGVYSAGISADVAKERLERYFTCEEGMYRISKEIREMLVFAVQDVIKDPPFTKLDLLVCRNLLIYLDADLQRRLLPVFHYALRPGGLLFLGPSESIGGLGELFEALDSKWKIFRRRETLTPIHPTMEVPPEPAPVSLPEPTAAGVIAGRVRQSHTATQVERLLLSRFAPTSLVVDEHGSIIYIHGRTGGYLEPAEGQPRHNILEMARPGLLRPLTAAIRQASVEKREVVQENLRVKTNGEFADVSLSVSWIDGPEALHGLLLVTISPLPAESRPEKVRRGKKAEAHRARTDRLENELQFTKESLQTTIEALETSNEELKSTNEELQSTNEELQSTNEELETSKEEMQSLNEELSTVNAELQAKVDELSRATDDMQNLLNSTQVATIFLDTQLNVKRYTEPATELFNLIPTDVGRPLAHLASNLEYVAWLDDSRDVLRTLEHKESEVRTNDGLWHLMRIMPYRTAENVIDGVVLTFVEISRVKQAEHETAAVTRCFADITQTAREPVLMLKSSLRVVSVNEAFCRLFQLSPEAVVGRNLYELDGGAWDIAPMRKLIEEVSRQGATISDFELAHDFPRIGHRRLLLNARQLYYTPEALSMIVISLAEVTAGGG